MNIEEYRRITSGKGSKGPRGVGGVLEKDIQDSILEYLAVKRILAWRNNTGAGIFKGKEGGKDRFIRFSRPGASDIFAIHNGTFYAIEVKRPGKPLSPDQEKFFSEVRGAGAVAILATCIEDVEKYI
jgi:hypothetical protein